ncbi:MAG TPA: NAD-dependent epimerase/dehydratase family protein [Vicinamibacterales bacterium]|nr:NAD-dependent epimerase/dehydratase family protein [Vicinamibacterales bacterium]
MTAARVLVTGGAGFIGHHLASALRRRGHWVRAVDVKPPEFGSVDADEFALLDLRRADDAAAATRGVDHVYALAADMGGMGYISQHDARILHDNTLIDFHTVEAARASGVSRLLYASSACIYPEYRQEDAAVTPLAEEHAYPAQPQDAYGWEKLITERLCLYYARDHAMETRIVRFHNIYGPEGTWDGGREKAPAALCRKVAQAKLTGAQEIEIWGDGQQTRSFCFIDDCVEGIMRLMASDHREPLNLGQDRLISINDLAVLIGRIAGWPVSLRHVPGPQGVRGRNSDNTRLRDVLGWEPRVTLEEGLAATYQWIEAQVSARLVASGTPV